MYLCAARREGLQDTASALLAQENRGGDGMHIHAAVPKCSALVLAQTAGEAVVPYAKETCICLRSPQIAPKEPAKGIRETFSCATLKQ